MSEKKCCLSCVAYEGVEGRGICQILGYNWALCEGVTAKNNLGLFYVPVEFNDENENNVITGSLEVSVFAGDSCPHYTKANENKFCEECGSRLAGMFPNFCHQCGHPVPDDFYETDEEE